MPRKLRPAATCARKTSLDDAGIPSEIGEADDGAAAAHALAIQAGLGHGGDALDELGLAHDALRRIAFAVHRAALDEHRVHHVVTGAADVLHEIVGEIAQLLAGIGAQFGARPPIPQVVVRIDDRLRRIERFFGRALEPSLQALTGDVPRHLRHRHASYPPDRQTIIRAL